MKHSSAGKKNTALSAGENNLRVGQPLSYLSCNNASMICRKKDYHIGDFVTAVNCFGGYRLPNEVPEGATVKLLGREAGYAQIGFQEKQFIVSEACIVSGWEYKLNGRWRDESDAVVSA